MESLSFWLLCVQRYEQINVELEGAIQHGEIFVWTLKSVIDIASALNTELAGLACLMALDLLASVNSSAEQIINTKFLFKAM